LLKALKAAGYSDKDTAAALQAQYGGATEAPAPSAPEVADATNASIPASGQIEAEKPLLSKREAWMLGMSHAFPRSASAMQTMMRSDAVNSGGSDGTAHIKNFAMWQSMPPGPEKDRFGEMLTTNIPSAVRTADNYAARDPAGRAVFQEANRPLIEVDRGGQVDLVAPGTGAPVRVLSKSLAPSDQPANAQAKAAATAKGSAQGTRQATALSDLAGAESQAKAEIARVRELLQHKGMETINSPLRSAYVAIPGAIGSPERDFDARLEQVKGNAMLAGYQAVKGTGQISNTESEAVTRAINRMKVAVSPEDFKKAAEDYIAEIVRVVQSTRKRAMQGSEAAK